MTYRKRTILSTLAASGVLILAAASILTLAAPAAPESSQATKMPKTLGFDISALDRSTDPCTDFYQFACGSWIKNNPIPPDRGYWGRGGEVQERNLAILRNILEKAEPPDPKRSPVMRQIGDLYASCMDEKTVEAKGAAPLQPELDRIAKLASKKDLAAEIAHLHVIGANEGPGRGVGGILFDFESLQGHVIPSPGQRSKLSRRVLMP